MGTVLKVQCLTSTLVETAEQEADQEADQDGRRGLRNGEAGLLAVTGRWQS